MVSHGGHTWPLPVGSRILRQPEGDAVTSLANASPWPFMIWAPPHSLALSSSLRTRHVESFGLGSSALWS